MTPQQLAVARQAICAFCPARQSYFVPVDLFYRCKAQDDLLLELPLLKDLAARCPLGYWDKIPEPPPPKPTAQAIDEYAQRWYERFRPLLDATKDQAALVNALSAMLAAGTFGATTESTTIVEAIATKAGVDLDAKAPA